MLDFVLPAEKNREDVLGFYDEIENNGERCIGIDGYKDYDKWSKGMKNRQTGKNLPEGYVKEVFFLCYEGDRLVGVFSIKYKLTEYLLNYGGHICYAVRPSDRNRGLATQMLRQGLCFARVDGFEKVLLVCDEDNLASEKVIQKNGGVFENRLFDADESVFVKRYWIQLRKAPL